MFKSFASIKLYNPMLSLPPLSLYVHFPWCIKKCPYCDFNSHTLKKDLPKENYLQTLLLDLESHQRDLQGRQFHSIFLGGGTPSLFPTNELNRFFEYLRTHSMIAHNAEVTIEANPGAIERGSFYDYKTMGINRISLGVQSFQNDKLKRLGRVHSQQSVYDAIEELKSSGFSNFNIDLMHGLPDQTLEDALFDLRSALACNPTHLSWYQLTIEPNTAFAQRPPQLPNEDVLFDIEIQGKKILLDCGFQQYETSAYALSEPLQAQHNLNYWQFGDYIGIGAGAHGKVSYPAQNHIQRHVKRKNPTLYMAKHTFPYRSEIIDNTDRPYEFMLNALRLQAGFSIELFEQTTGLPIECIQSRIDKAQDRKLLIQHGNYFIPTKLGQQFLNDLLYLFI